MSLAMERLEEVSASAGPSTASSSTPITASILMERASRMLDLKTRIPFFSGDEKGWGEFRFRLETSCKVLGLGQILDQAVAASFEQLDALSAHGKECATFIFQLLIEVCKGAALDLVRPERGVNGMAAWKRLVEQYDPAVPYKFTARLATLLSPVWRSDQQYLPQLLAWEKSLLQYEADSHSVVPSEVRCAVIAKHAPFAVRQFLRLHPEDLARGYALLKHALMDYHQRGQVYRLPELSGASEAVPMDISAMIPFKGNKSKGQYRIFPSKGFGKGSGGKGFGKGFNNPRGSKGPQLGRGTSSGGKPSSSSSSAGTGCDSLHGRCCA